MKPKCTNENVMLSVDVLHRHPQNPRKGVGDVTELADSIKKNGVMQNLTVIPGYWDGSGNHHDEEYTLLIGHRRFTAAKLAGITELPCRIIEGMSEKEQIATMLEENMQRTDLTIWEQANSFQLMLDLGETEDSIANKTGFSKQTIKHRLNLAKLDGKELKKKEKDGTFQLSLKDLYELEKIKDIETRNKILKESNDSRDLVWKAHQAADQEIINERYAKLEEMFKSEGIKKAPKKVVESGRWSQDWKHLHEWDLKDKDLDMSIPEDALKKITKECYYVKWNYSSEVAIIAPNKRVQSKKTKEQEEISRRQRNQKDYKSRYKDLMERKDTFIHEIIDGKIDDIKENVELCKELFDAINDMNVYIGNYLITFIAGKEAYGLTEEEKKAATEKASKLSVTHKMLIYLSEGLNNKTPINWNGEFDKEKAELVLEAFGILGKWGWTFEESEKALLDGTCELFEKGGKK